MKKYFKSLMCILGAGMILLSGCGNSSENANSPEKPKKKDYDIFIYNGDTNIGKAFREMCDEYTKRTGVIIRTVTPSEEENTIENLDSYLNSQYPPDIYTVSSIDELTQWQQTENIWDFNNATEEKFKEVVNKIPVGLRLSSDTANSFGIPTTIRGHGLIVDPKMIASLFGGDKYLKVLNDLQLCSYEEFSYFVDALNSYISSGVGYEVTLNGKNYSFTSGKGELSEKLNGVFSFSAPDSSLSGSYIMNPILASIFSTPSEAFIANDTLLENLKNPFRRYMEVLDLISTYTAGNMGTISRGIEYTSSSKNGLTPSIKNFINGKSVFLLGNTSDYEKISIFDVSVAKRCVFIPIKVPIDEQDIFASGKQLNKNLNKSITLSVPSYYCINSRSSENEKRAAQDFLAWLETSELAQKYVVSEFGYVPFGIKDGNVLDNPLDRSMINYVNEERFLPGVFMGAPKDWCSNVGKRVVNTLLNKYSWSIEDTDSFVKYALDKWKELKNN